MSCLQLATDPAFFDANGRSALHFACRDNNICWACKLIKLGATNRADDRGLTPLHEARRGVRARLISRLNASS